MTLPRWIVTLLHRVLPPERHDDIVGDLEELHRRRLRRWGPVRAGAVSRVEGVALIVRHGLGRAISGIRRDGWISGSELRLALRLLLKQPVVTLTSVVALSLGIGIAAGGFSLFAQVLWGDVPFEGGDRWVVVQSYDADTGRPAPLDLRRLRLFRSSAPAFEHIAAAESREFNLVHESGEVERVSGARVTPGIFAYLPHTPVAGRLPVVGDGSAGSGPVALIRESLWMRRYSGSPDIVGRTIRIGGDPHRVVGVLPDDAGYPSGGEIWVLLDEETAGAEAAGDPMAGSRAVGILAPGATVEEASAQVGTLSSQSVEADGGTPPLRHRVVPITDTIRSTGTRLGALAVTGVLLAVLLVIAVNVANLVVARTSRRAAELAVRTALGASRGRLVGQLFAEVLVLGLLAAVPGLVTAEAILATYDRVIDELPFWMELSLDPITAVAVVVLAVLASAAVGLVPALRATRADPADALRASGRGASLGIGRLGGAMIMAEVALAVALLGSAFLFARGFRAYVDPAFDLPDGRVLTARVLVDVDTDELTAAGASTVSDSVSRATDAIRRELSRLPGVGAVGVTARLPRLSPRPEPVELEGRGEVVEVPLVVQGPGVFEALEVRPLAGRLIEERDLEAGAPPVVVVNESFAGDHFGTVQVLGRRIRTVPDSTGAPAAPWREIVGVVPDVMEVAAPAGASGVYVPGIPGRLFFVAARVGRDPMAFAGALRRALFDLDPGLVVSDVVGLDGVGAENRTALAVLGSAMSGLGLVTLLLALAGVYSIVSLAVTRRTREIGVRVALGASRASIVWSILRRSGTLVVGGALVGALVGLLGSRVRVFTFVVPGGGPWLFTSLVLLMAVAGALACWLPMRRALTIHPVEALRHDG